MPTTLDKKAVEQSTFVVTASFTDENGDTVVPNTLKWSLVDRSEKVINERDQVEINSPSANENIVLSGNDLKIVEGRIEETRHIVLEYTYDSDLGNDLPGKEQVDFKIVNLKHIK